MLLLTDICCFAFTVWFAVCSEAANDLHCNPVQTFPYLPSTGATLTSFATYYWPNDDSTSTPAIVRMAVYQVLTNGSYVLLGGTTSVSDLVLPVSSTVGPVLVTSPSGPFQYGSTSQTSITILPSLRYSLCLMDNAQNQSVNDWVYQGAWIEPSTTNLPQAFENYYLSQPLPTLYVGNAVSSTSWNSQGKTTKVKQILYCCCAKLGINHCYPVLFSVFVLFLVE